MRRKNITLVSLASALAALNLGAYAHAALDSTSPDSMAKSGQNAGPIRPNAFFNAGEHLMGLVATTHSDGTVIAQHVSHESHASHASHASHYSGS